MGQLAGTHDIGRDLFTVAGRPVRGGGENDFVSIVRDEQAYVKKYGSRGRVTRSKTNADGGTMTLTLEQTDIEDIRYLDGIADRPSPLDIVPLMYYNAETNVTYIAEQAWIQKPPDEAYNKASSTRVYVFDCAKIVKRHGFAP
jgi:hypothetical protein